MNLCFWYVILIFDLKSAQLSLTEFIFDVQPHKLFRKNIQEYIQKKQVKAAALHCSTGSIAPTHINAPAQPFRLAKIITA
jgi:hypothetical protein